MRTLKGWEVPARRSDEGGEKEHERIGEERGNKRRRMLLTGIFEDQTRVLELM